MAIENKLSAENIFTELKSFTFCPQDVRLNFDFGKTPTQLTIAYETLGKLNSEGDNAILIIHALTGDAHVGGLYQGEKEGSGWWDPVVGPGKPFDSNKYFIICSNVLGGCKGTTGPSSIDPSTGTPYGTAFPFITIRDMIRVQKVLLDYLGVKRLLCVVGGSMGGMEVLQWALEYPDFLESYISLAAASAQTAMAIAYNAVARKAIMNDPAWNGGQYYGRKMPDDGLALARMIATITYKSEKSFDFRFNRAVQEGCSLTTFDTSFAIESYLKYQGDKIVQRFDANSYLYLTKAMDFFDLREGYHSLETSLQRIKGKGLIVGISSDILYPVHLQRGLVWHLKKIEKDVRYFELKSPFGHDAFLIEFEKLTPVFRSFLAYVQDSK